MLSLLVVSALLLVSLKCQDDSTLGDFNTECKYYWDSSDSDELEGAGIIAIAPDQCAFFETDFKVYYEFDGESATVKDTQKASEWWKCNGNELSYEAFDGDSKCNEANSDTSTSTVIESDCSTSDNCNCDGNSCAISMSIDAFDETCPNYDDLIEALEGLFDYFGATIEIRSLKAKAKFYLAINDQDCWDVSNDTWTYSVDFDCGPPSDGSSDKHVITLEGYKSSDCSGSIDDTYQFPEDPDECFNGTATITLNCDSANSLFLIYAFAIGIIITLFVQ